MSSPEPIVMPEQPSTEGAIAVARGRNFDYWSGVIFPMQSITVLVVPVGAAFYLDYLSFSCFNTIPEGTVFYVAIDGKPILMNTHFNQTANLVLPRPLLFKYTMTVGPLGGSSWPSQSMMITYAGDVHA